ncbi:hypothetical protein EVG20_g4330 [Dentipellis fragilis]|uniref:F-box domain-containing protein n=1 Tax=Dentipellis fragilis TaxID=205917 RepID=A0A4Y9YX03_9AGAM|nr:hypothetical protein EVG20_g4330 [Dentipellis fragilis]
MAIQQVNRASGRAKAISPIARLPVETLSDVFSHLSNLWIPGSAIPTTLSKSGPASPRRSDLGWITITHVSKHWRHVAISYTCLWGNINFDLGKKWADTMLARAQTAPIILEWDIRNSRGFSATTMTTYVSGHLSHIKTLVLDVDSSSLPRFWKALNLSTPMLTTLSMGVVDGSLLGPAPPMLLGKNSPCLRELTLHSCAGPWGSLIFQNLVFLSIEWLDVEDPCPLPNLPTLSHLFSTLRMASSLERLYIEFGDDHIKIDDTFIHGLHAVSLPRLRDLRLQAEMHSFVAILKHLDFPMDANCELYCNSHDQIAEYVLDDLCSTLKNRLKNRVFQTHDLPILHLCIKEYSWGEFVLSVDHPYLTLMVSFARKAPWRVRKKWLSSFLNVFPPESLTFLDILALEPDFYEWTPIFEHLSLRSIHTLSLSNAAVMFVPFLHFVSGSESDRLRPSPYLLPHLDTLILSRVIPDMAQHGLEDVRDTLGEIIVMSQGWRVPLRKIVLRDDDSFSASWITEMLQDFVDVSLEPSH